MIYFIQEEGGGPVKIGYAVDVAERVERLQTGNPRRLIVVASCEGDQLLEAAFHRTFMLSAVRSEWFADDKIVLLAVRWISGGCPSETVLKRAAAFYKKLRLRREHRSARGTIERYLAHIADQDKPQGYREYVETVAIPRSRSRLKDISRRMAPKARAVAS